MFVDSNCQVRSDSIDSEVESALDVANQIAMAATNRCGVVGHLYPLSSPFGRLRCNATHFDFSQYWDWQCSEQIERAYQY